MRLTHRLRELHDFILVGVGTMLSDDPQLNARIPTLLPLASQPRPLILDSHLRTPPSAKLMRNHLAGIGHQPTILHRPHPSSSSSPSPSSFSDKKTALEAAGASVVCLSEEGGSRASIPAILSHISGKGSLMVEGGATVISSFLASGLVDLVVVTIAPVFVGEGISMIQGEVRIPKFKHVASKVFGPDPRRRAPPSQAQPYKVRQVRHNVDPTGRGPGPWLVLKKGDLIALTDLARPPGRTDEYTVDNYASVDGQWRRILSKPQWAGIHREAQDGAITKAWGMCWFGDVTGLEPHLYDSAGKPPTSDPEDKAVAQLRQFTADFIPLQGGVDDSKEHRTRLVVSTHPLSLTQDILDRSSSGAFFAGNYARSMHQMATLLSGDDDFVDEHQHTPTVERSRFPNFDAASRGVFTTVLFPFVVSICCLIGLSRWIRRDEQDFDSFKHMLQQSWKGARLQSRRLVKKPAGSSLLRLLVSILLVGIFIFPMAIMRRYTDTDTQFITLSLFILGFAWLFQLSMDLHETFVATATIAAVLVVFLSSNQSGTRSGTGN
ncbi:hypothetical protein RQP46_007601 [Phenoliferia psychrophenolica]